MWAGCSTLPHLLLIQAGFREDPFYLLQDRLVLSYGLVSCAPRDF